VRFPAVESTAEKKETLRGVFSANTSHYMNVCNLVKIVHASEYAGLSGKPIVRRLDVLASNDLELSSREARPTSYTASSQGAIGAGYPRPHKVPSWATRCLSVEDGGNSKRPREGLISSIRLGRFQTKRSDPPLATQAVRAGNDRRPEPKRAIRSADVLPSTGRQSQILSHLLRTISA
jgi:hypothetical protein